MSQNSVDFSTNPSGTQLLDSLLTPMKQNILTNNAGTSRPPYAVAHTTWTDITTTPWVVKYFDGTDDITLGTVNATSNVFIPSGFASNKTNGTTAPTINDDSGDGYSVGSLWVDVTADKSYICVDSTVGAAIWFNPAKSGANTDITSLLRPAITGISDGSSASAGVIGEIITSNASGVALTTATPANVTSITLTAGKWVIDGIVDVLANGSSTLAIASISTTSATIGTIGSLGTTQNAFPAVTGARQILSTGSVIVNISGSTTYYLIARSDFSTSTTAASGTINARRF